jgi:hypothetical protein
VNAKSDCRFLNFCGLQTHLNHHSVVIPMPYVFYRRKTGQWLQKWFVMLINFARATVLAANA